MAGYSGTPLVKKLGFKEGYKVRTYNAPEHYLQLLGKDLPKFDLNNLFGNDIDIDAIHFFSKSKDELSDNFPKLISSIKPNGMIWISWPKKVSKVETDLNENIIREIGLNLGIVDIKVAAVDEIWSGLKFVIRKENR